MGYYDTHLGTTFGFTFDPVKGIIPQYHSFRDFGLHPRSKPVIETPDVQTVTFKVPGRNGEFDVTEFLTGDVRYNNRDASFEFSQIGGRRLWDATYHRLKNALHGKRMKILIDEEADGYYVGRLTVAEPEYDSEKGVAYFTIEADLEPYKYSINKNTEPWLWDNLNFETGMIYGEDEGNSTEVTSAEPSYIYYNGYREGATELWLAQNTMPFVPTIIVEGSASVTMNYPTDAGRKNVVLAAGRNREAFPDFVIRDEPNYVKFTTADSETATVTMEFRAGWL